MVVFLANRANLQEKRLHDRIKRMVQSEFTDVQRRRADPREPGAYRIVGDVDPRRFLDNANYPTETARIGIGFQLRTNDPHEFYWFNWIEPDRRLLVGWHQDGTHDELGPVHRQVNNGGVAVVHEPDRFIDAHPLNVVSRRLEALPELVLAVEWNEGRPVGFNSTVSAGK